MAAPSIPGLDALAKLPQCAQAPASQGIMQSGCGFDFACICTNEEFLTLLQRTIPVTCDPQAQQATLSAAKELCTSAVPSLNDSRQTEVAAAIIIMMLLAVTAVILRLVARKLSAVRYGIDDLLILVALLLTCGLNASTFVGLHFGYATHQIRLSLSDITGFAKNNFATQIVFACALTTIKLSLLVFYHRIFPVRKFTIASSITGMVTIAWCIALVFSVIFGCKPVNYFWDRTMEGGHCINEQSLSYGITAANICTDIAVLVLPIPWLWNLQLKAAKKLAVIAMFVLGCFVCIAGIVRIPLLTKVKEYDVTWTIVSAGIWINVECNIGIVSACLPVMRPLLSRIPPLPKSLHFGFSSLSNYFNSRSSRSSFSIEEKLSNSTSSKASKTAMHSHSKAHEWPQAVGIRPKIKTYRSAAEGYGGSSIESSPERVLPEGVASAKNRTLWVDDGGLGQTLHSHYDPRRPPRDEEEAVEWQMSSTTDDKAKGTARKIEGYRQIYER